MHDMKYLDLFTELLQKYLNSYAWFFQVRQQLMFVEAALAYGRIQD